MNCIDKTNPTKVWEKSNIIVVDKLGKDFLDAIKTDDIVEVKEDGTVNII